MGIMVRWKLVDCPGGGKGGFSGGGGGGGGHGEGTWERACVGVAGSERGEGLWVNLEHFWVIEREDRVWMRVGEKAERLKRLLMRKAEREVRRVERVLLVAKIQCKSLYSNGR